MNELDILDIDTKDLREKADAAKKLANDYSKTLKELYDCFSKLKEQGVIQGSGNVDVFINSIKNDLNNYNKLSNEIKKHFEVIENVSEAFDSSIRRIENDKAIL